MGYGCWAPFRWREKGVARLIPRGRGSVAVQIRRRSSRERWEKRGKESSSIGPAEIS